jgi:hypothetical protein
MLSSSLQSLITFTAAEDFVGQVYSIRYWEKFPLLSAEHWPTASL